MIASAQTNTPHKLKILQRFRRAVTDTVLKGILGAICKIEYSEFVGALSKTKPLIIVMNHINFLEVPILVTHCRPFSCTGIAKVETWKNPILSYLFNTYKAIPINRGGSYRETFKKVRQAIEKGFFVVIAPEGTRSKDGVLKKAKAGIIQLAIDTDSAILPIAHFGGEKVWNNMKHFRRTSFQFKAGQPFRIKCEGRPVKSERQVILDEIMGQIARLLPEEMRGVYSEQAEQECKHLEFIGNYA